MFLRHKRDESPEEREKTVEYVVQKLQNKDEHASSLDPRGRPVVVTFHRRVKIFYYVSKNDGPLHQVTAPFPQCVEIAERCTESDPRPWLADSVLGEPTSLDDKQSRKVFKDWIRLFW
ncbi:hypothetical protein BDV10DRAFT_162237 [Aspergillus recurvatus]